MTKAELVEKWQRMQGYQKQQQGRQLIPSLTVLRNP